jgi:hypothetical protein
MRHWFTLLTILTASHVAGAETLKDYIFKNPPSLGTIPGVGQARLGGLSGLILEKIDPKTGIYHFLSLTDRGLNSAPADYRKDGILDRIMLLPKFSPLLVEIAFNPKTGTVSFGKMIPMKTPHGEPSSGKSNVNPRGTEKLADEGIVSPSKEPLAMDPWGIDSESIAMDSGGFIWIGEEYGPSISKMARDGRILSRFLPEGAPKERAGIRVLPSTFAEREPNRGFEALVVKGDSLFAFLQSPIKKIDGPVNVRVLEFDIPTEKTKGVYYYEMSMAGAKIGDATLSPEGDIIVLEHTVEPKKNLRHQALFQVDFAKATNLLNPLPEGTKTEPALSIKIASFGSLASGEFEKLEGLAALPDGSFAIVNDNDFNVDYHVSKMEKKALPKIVDSHFFILKK